MDPINNLNYNYNYLYEYSSNSNSENSDNRIQANLEEENEESSESVSEQHDQITNQNQYKTPEMGNSPRQKLPSMKAQMAAAAKKRNGFKTNEEQTPTQLIYNKETSSESSCLSVFYDL